MGVFSSVLNAQFCHEIVVRFRVFTLEVLHQTTAFAHFFDQTTARGVVFFVCLQVFDELGNLCAQEGDLHLRRTGIVCMGLKFFDQLLFLSCVQHRGGI